MQLRTMCFRAKCFNTWPENLQAVNCLICKQFAFELGTAALPLERGGMTLVVKHIVTRVRLNCDEGYTNKTAADQAMEIAEQAFRPGMQIDVREYAFSSA